MDWIRSDQNFLRCFFLAIRKDVITCNCRKKIIPDRNISNLSIVYTTQHDALNTQFMLLIHDPKYFSFYKTRFFFIMIGITDVEFLTVDDLNPTVYI